MVYRGPNQWLNVSEAVKVLKREAMKETSGRDQTRKTPTKGSDKTDEK